MLNATTLEDVEMIVGEGDQHTPTQGDFQLRRFERQTDDEGDGSTDAETYYELILEPDLTARRHDPSSTVRIKQDDFLDALEVLASEEDAPTLQGIA